MVDPAEIAAETSSLDSCLSRRRFLILRAATVSVVVIEGLFSGRLVTAERAEYEGQMIGTLGALRVGEPVPFSYPRDHPNAQKPVNQAWNEGLRRYRSGRGCGGLQHDVPHMGFPMQDTFNPEHQVLGPCGWHLSTCDLTRHGMVVSGHATSGLPQIILEARNDEIHATGVQSLIYGFSDNELDPST